jgi:excisionase family DNA binding protein
MNEAQCRAILGWKEANPEWTGNYDYYNTAKPFSGELSPIQHFSPLELPPILTVEEICAVFRSTTVLERICDADWLVPLPHYQEEDYFTAEAVYMALARLIKGEKPPRSRSEKPAIPGEPEIDSKLPFENYISPQEAAEFLSISASTLRDHSEQGIIRSYRVRPTSHRRYKLSELEAVMQRNASESFGSKVEGLKDLLR